MGRSSLAIAAALLTVTLGACGDDQESVESETVKLELVKAKFPARQKLAEPQTMQLTVRNPTERAVETVSATVSPGDAARAGSGFNTAADNPNASDPSTPIWIVDEGPTNGVTVDPAVTRLGPVAPGETVTFRWQLMPSRVGSYKVRWLIGGDLQNKVNVVGQDGDPIEGTFPVRISR
jgi:hypothetical protein